MSFALGPDDSAQTVVSLLLAKGARANARNLDDDTILIQAVHRFMGAPASVEVLALLIEHGAEVNATGFNGMGPLHHVARPEQALFLLKHGADPNLADTNGRWTPLHWAAMRGSKELVEHMIAFGARGDVPDIFGRLPADVAQANGHEQLASRLRTMTQPGR